MMQKIVIEIQPKCNKCRIKAMKIAALAAGVISVALEGEWKNQVVVTGDCVDAACLVRSMRKKLKFANLNLVQLL